MTWDNPLDGMLLISFRMSRSLPLRSPGRHLPHSENPHRYNLYLRFPVGGLVKSKPVLKLVFKRNNNQITDR